MVTLWSTFRSRNGPQIDREGSSKPTAALAASENIKLYLQSVLEMGVRGMDAFLVDDLRTGRAMRLVCRVRGWDGKERVVCVCVIVFGMGM